MTLANFMMSSETQAKLRRQGNFIEGLVVGETYKIKEIECCLEYANRERNGSRTTAIYLDEHGNQYSFLKLRGNNRELMKYLDLILAEKQ